MPNLYDYVDVLEFSEIKEMAMYKDLFKRIIEASQTESLTFFVGAGISKLSDAPKWFEHFLKTKLYEAKQESVLQKKSIHWNWMIAI